MEELDKKELARMEEILKWPFMTKAEFLKGHKYLNTTFSFQKEKKEFLTKKDKSKKGSLDKEIIKLISTINKNNNYYTTSSCSGRIIMIALDRDDKKNQAKWLFVSHKKINNLNNIKKILNNLPKKDVWLRQESLIMHVCCSTIEAAQKLLELADKAGLRRAGIRSTKHKTIVELIGAEHLDAIIAKKGKLIITENYLKTLIDEANYRMQKNSETLKKIEFFWRTEKQSFSCEIRKLKILNSIILKL